jgi:hypothetical protein
VTEYSIDEFAERAEVARDYVDRLVELGILSPGQGDLFSQAQLRRGRLPPLEIFTS